MRLFCCFSGGLGVLLQKHVLPANQHSRTPSLPYNAGGVAERDLTSEHCAVTAWNTTKQYNIQDKNTGVIALKLLDKRWLSLADLRLERRLALPETIPRRT